MLYSLVQETPSFSNVQKVQYEGKSLKSKDRYYGMNRKNIPQ